MFLVKVNLFPSLCITCHLQIKKRQIGELTAHLYTLEHIAPQKLGHEYIGMVGNILPLCAEINGDIADKDPKEKLSYYSKSELILVKEFVDEVNSDDFDLDNWNEEQIKTRTESIAKLAYELD